MTTTGKPVLYTAGYTGASQEWLQSLAAAGALILDIRLSPRSRVPRWQGLALMHLLGDRYEWCRELGNVNYRADLPIEIQNLTLGLETLRERLTHGPVVLLCACAEVSRCHRRVVAEAATRFLGCEVVDLRPGGGLRELLEDE